MSTFDCKDFEQRIHEILDQRGSLQHDVPLAQHRAVCRDCQQQFDEFICLSALLRRKPQSVATGKSLPPQRIAANDSQRWQIVIAALLVLALFIGLRPAQRATARTLASLRVGESAWPPSLWPSSFLFPSAYEGPAASDVGAVAATGPATPQTIASQAQQILATIEGIPASLGELEPYCVYTASLTGVTTLTAPVSLTMDMLRRRWNQPPKPVSPIRSDRSEWMLRHLRQA